MDSLTVERVREHLNETIAIKHAFLNDRKQVMLLAKVADLCVETYRNGNKILIAGNGGSAADAQHFAGELVSRFNFDRQALPALALTTDTSIITAIGNDYGYEEIFSRQIYANGVRGDLFLAISTSGNSPNILKAIAAARIKGMGVIGLTGEYGGRMLSSCDYCICAPSQSTPRIQECHLAIEHFICAHIELSLFNSEESPVEAIRS